MVVDKPNLNDILNSKKDVLNNTILFLERLINALKIHHTIATKDILSCKDRSEIKKKNVLLRDGGSAEVL